MTSRGLAGLSGELRGSLEESAMRRLISLALAGSALLALGACASDPYSGYAPGYSTYGDGSYYRDREYYLNQYYGGRGYYDRYGNFRRY